MSDSRSASALSGEVPAAPAVAVVSIEDRSVMFRDHAAMDVTASSNQPPVLEEVRS